MTTRLAQMKFGICEEAMNQLLVLLRLALPTHNRIPTFQQAKQYMLSQSLAPGTPNLQLLSVIGDFRVHFGVYQRVRLF